MLTLLLNNKKKCLGLFFLLSYITVQGQSLPILNVKIPTHNFGFVQEDGGIIKHTFHLTNIGDKPLVITKVTTSCGCTLTEWTQAPIAPGEVGIVDVSFNPLGRPGPFFKTIIIRSNAKNPNVQLSISGHVQSRKHKFYNLSQLPYSLGPLKIEEKYLGFHSVSLGSTLEEKIQVYNNTDNAITPEINKGNHYFSIKFSPQTIEPKQEGTIIIRINGQKINKPGRIEEEIQLIFNTNQGIKENAVLPLYANVIENYTRWSKLHKRDAGHAELSSNNLILSPKNDKNKRYSQEFTIENNGKKILTIYSLTAENKKIQIKGSRKIIKPGKSITISIAIKEKDFIHKTEGNIILNCSDPDGPIRIIKYKAEK